MSWSAVYVVFLFKIVYMLTAIFLATFLSTPGVSALPAKLELLINPSPLIGPCFQTHSLLAGNAAVSRACKRWPAMRVAAQWAAKLSSKSAYLMHLPKQRQPPAPHLSFVWTQGLSVEMLHRTAAMAAGQTAEMLVAQLRGRLLPEARLRLACAAAGTADCVLLPPSDSLAEAHNMAGSVAHSKQILFLDAHIMPVAGAVEMLQYTLERTEDTASVGPLLMEANSNTTTAGGVIFADGSHAAMRTGRALIPTLNRLRQADFVGPECEMVRRPAFLLAGGRDGAVPGLSMAYRARGLRTMLQPLAVAVSLAAPRKEYDNESHAAFFSKWGPALFAAGHCPPGTPLSRAADRYASPRVLWIDDVVPTPARDSGSQRTELMLEALAEAGWGVTFLPSSPEGDDFEGGAALRAAGVAVLPARPPAAWRFRHANGSCVFDAFVVARRDVFAPIRDILRAQCPSTPVVFDTVDLHYLREARAALSAARPWDFDAASSEGIEAWLTGGSNGEVLAHRRAELDLVATADITLVTSTVEARLLKVAAPKARTAVVSNMYRETDLRRGNKAPCAARDAAALFVGTLAHRPNLQAVETLVRDVLPLVRAKGVNMTLHVVGSTGGEDGENVRTLLEDAEGVEFHPELSPEGLMALYGRVRAAVAPLLSGAGVKGKVAEAWRHGVPLVATSIALEGMVGVEGEVKLTPVDSPAEFAAQLVAAVAGDCVAWERAARSGPVLAAINFSLRQGREALVSALEEALGGEGGGRRQESPRCA